MAGARRPIREGSLWAVFVGVNEYEDTNWCPLPFCNNDASELANLFRDPDRGYPASHTRLLVGPTGKRSSRPTRSNVIDAIDKLSTIATEEDIVLFGFFGHGLAVRGVTYLFTSDGLRSQPKETAISLRRVQKALEQSRARVKVLIIDACHSGTLHDRRAPEERMSGAFARTLEQLGHSEGWAVLSSCKQDEASHDYEEGKHGAFSYFLLEGLRGAADSDKDQLVTVHDAYRYAAQMTSSWAFERGYRQTPELSCNVAGGDIVLIAAPERPQLPRPPDSAKQGLPSGPTKAREAAPSDPGGDRLSDVVEAADDDIIIPEMTLAIERNPQNAAAYTRRGAAYYRSGEIDKAIADFTECIRFNQSHSTAYHNRGEAYRIKGEYDKAIIDLKKATELHPQDTQAHNNLGACFFSLGDFGQAIAAFSEAIRLDPQLVIAYLNRGWVYFKMREHDKAIADLSKATQLDAQNANAYNTLATCHVNKGDFEQAVAALNEAIRLNPQFALAYHNRAKVFETLGDNTSAARDARMAEELAQQAAGS